MWIKTVVLFLCITGNVLGYCRNSITVTGVSGSFGNQLVNGEYVKLYDHKDDQNACDSRDVFNHTTADVYLYHIGDLTGYWMIRDTYDCNAPNAEDAYVRSKDGELNPGLIQFGWEQNSNDGWITDNDIDVDCYVIPRCRYHLSGAVNTSLNGYYDELDNSECEFRDVHKHETQDIYLYFKWSDVYNEYYWIVNRDWCVDAVHNGAYLFNDDYSVSPELILDDWLERDNASDYFENLNLDIDCFGGAAKPGMYMSMALAVLVFWSIL